MFTDFWVSQGYASEQIPFDGRSDYVGFTDRGIPAGGIFAGAEAPKTKAQVRLYGGVAGEQLDPCYHLFCDRLSSILDAPPVDVLANPASAKKMLGGGRRSMEQFLPAMTHTIWYFAEAKDPLPARPTTASAQRILEQRMRNQSAEFKYRGHQLARQR